MCRLEGLKASIKPSPFGPSQVSTRPMREAKNTSSTATKQAPIYRRMPLRSCRRASQKGSPFFRMGKAVFLFPPDSFHVPLMAFTGAIRLMRPVQNQTNPISRKRIAANAARQIEAGSVDGISNPVVVTVNRQIRPDAGIDRSVPATIPHRAVMRYCKSCIPRSFPLVNPIVLRIPILT